MLAVVLSPARVGAALQRILRALTAHVVQQDGPGARAEVAAPRGPERVAAAQKAAHDTGVLDAPVVVAHRAPHAPVPDLNTALAAAASIDQAQRRVCGKPERESGGKNAWAVSYPGPSQVSFVIYNRKENTGGVLWCYVPSVSLSPSFSLPPSLPTFLCCIHSFTTCKSLIN